MSKMQIGAVFPTTEIGNDPLVIRDWAQSAEELGYAITSSALTMCLELSTQGETQSYLGHMKRTIFFTNPLGSLHTLLQSHNASSL